MGFVAEACRAYVNGRLRLLQFDLLLGFVPVLLGRSLFRIAMKVDVIGPFLDQAKTIFVLHMCLAQENKKLTGYLRSDAKT